MERTLILVDVSSLIHKAVYVAGDLSYKGTCTGGLKGVVGQVATAIETLQPTDVIYCKDHAPYYRSEQVEQFKGARKTKAAKDPVTHRRIQESKRLVSEFLKIQPCPVWDVLGMEADDLIAYAFFKYRHRYDRIVIMTGDSDIYQLFGNKGAKLEIWLGKRKGIFGLEDFTKKFGGMSGKDHIRYQAITGGHNGLRGVPGYGDMKAKLALTGKGHWKILMREWSEVVWGNIRMMTLPHPRIKLSTHLLTLTYNDDSDIKEIRKYLHSWGIVMTPRVELSIRKFMDL